MKIRAVTPDDTPAICRIYNYYVEHTPATFELVPVAEAEMWDRIAKILAAGFPYFVAEAGQDMIGYIYLNVFRPRAAYDRTLELTIYLDKDVQGKGYGSRLFEYLLARIDRGKVHTLISGITLPNPASVALHEKFGFRQVAFLKEVGRKSDVWQDVGYWQLFFNNPVDISFRQVTEDKKRYLPLLLLADPDEEMIDRYLDVGEMFVLETAGEIIAEAVVVRISDELCELKNLAVEPARHRQGWGDLMLQRLAEHYRNRCRTMQVGTSNPVFYEKTGFVYSHTIEDFFLQNYPDPIFDEGVQCIDMIYLNREL